MEKPLKKEKSNAEDSKAQPKEEEKAQKEKQPNVEEIPKCTVSSITTRLENKEVAFKSAIFYGDGYNNILINVYHIPHSNRSKKKS